MPSPEAGDTPPTPSPSAKKQRLPRLPGRFSFYGLVLRPIFFRIDPELIHDIVMGLASLVTNVRPFRASVKRRFADKVKPLPVRFAGLEAPTPIGLAAGFDKNGTAVPFFESLGFGFVEVGTVTPRPQIGNPRPRLLRMPERRAIVNRMGFNNDGLDAVSLSLSQTRERTHIPVGVNLGKNRDTPNSEAVRDYELLFKAFQSTASYFTVNISSPNTPGLRDLQSSAFVTSLGSRVDHLRSNSGLSQPVFIKLAPDLGSDELKAICALCGPGKSFSGLVLTNTLPTDLGGLSGFPLKGPSTAMLKAARAALTDEVPIISVGGIETAADIIERFTLGATAVQLYSAFIYRGPAVVRLLMHELHAILRKRGIRSLPDLRQH